MYLHASLRERQNEFNKKLLRKARKDHEADYIKCLTPYVNIHTPIKFKCLKCGLTFTRNPVSIFKNKVGICPNHVRRVLSDVIRYKQQSHYHKELIAKEKKTGEYNLIKQLTPYKDWNYDIKFKCLVCGSIFIRKPSSIYGCTYICKHRAYINKCKNSRRSQAFNLKYAKSLVYKQVGDEYCILSKHYKNNRVKLMFEHHSRNCIYYQRYNRFYKFKMALGTFLAGHRCPEDGRYISHLKFKKTLKEFKREVNQFSHRKYLVKSKYMGNKHQVLIEHHFKQCPYYRKYHRYYQWWVWPSDFLRFHSICPKERFIKIANAHRNSLSNVKHKIARVAGYTFKVLSKTYVDEYTKILMIHKSKRCPYYRRYGKYYKFYVAPTNFYASPKCPYDSISCGERAVMMWLNHHGLKQYCDYTYAYILKDRFCTKRHQHLDFYLPHVRYNNYYTNGVGIEFDGVQHFKMMNFDGHNKNDVVKSCNNLINNILRDQIKNQYCYNHRIKLIRIKNQCDYQGKRLRRLVKKTLDSRLLSYITELT